MYLPVGALFRLDTDNLRDRLYRKTERHRLLGKPSNDPLIGDANQEMWYKCFELDPASAFIDRPEDIRQRWLSCYFAGDVPVIRVEYCSECGIIGTLHHTQTCPRGF